MEKRAQWDEAGSVSSVLNHCALYSISCVPSYLLTGYNIFVKWVKAVKVSKVGVRLSARAGKKISKPRTCLLLNFFNLVPSPKESWFQFLGHFGTFWKNWNRNWNHIRNQKGIIFHFRLQFISLGWKCHIIWLSPAFYLNFFVSYYLDYLPLIPYLIFTI